MTIYYKVYWINIINYVHANGPVHNENASCVYCLTCFGFRMKAMRWHPRRIRMYSTVRCHENCQWSSFLVNNILPATSMYIVVLFKYVRIAIIFYVAFLVYRSQLIILVPLIIVPSTLITTSVKAVKTNRTHMAVGWVQSLQQLRTTKTREAAWRTRECPLSTEDVGHVSLRCNSSASDVVLLLCSMMMMMMVDDRTWIIWKNTCSKLYNCIGNMSWILGKHFGSKWDITLPFHSLSP